MSVSTPRVVVTGLGIVSPIGIDVGAFTESVLAGHSGIELVDPTVTTIAGLAAGEVRDFEAKKYLKPIRRQLRVMCREIQIGVASAALALDNAGIDPTAVDHQRLGIDFAANLMLSPPEVLGDACWKCIRGENGEAEFDFDEWGETGIRAMEPLWLLRYLPNMPACHIGIMVDARGPSNSLTQDEASGNLVLGEANRILQRGAADMMIAGTTGTRVHPIKSMHARLWDELGTGDGPPSSWSRPFDKDRNGQVVAEGACTFLLENEEHAKARGATILATLLGTGASCVADRSGKPDPRRAIANAIRGALKVAELSPDDIGHVNAHGLSDPAIDAAESGAIHDVFGARGSEIPVTAPKSFLGNAGSGCGLLEFAASIVSLREGGTVPRTLNYESADPDCPLNVIHGKPLATDNRIVLNVDVTRVGQASAAIVEVA